MRTCTVLIRACRTTRLEFERSKSDGRNHSEIAFLHSPKKWGTGEIVERQSDNPSILWKNYAGSLAEGRGWGVQTVYIYHVM